MSRVDRKTSVVTDSEDPIGCLPSCQHTPLMRGRHLHALTYNNTSSIGSYGW